MATGVKFADAFLNIILDDKKAIRGLKNMQRRLNAVGQTMSCVGSAGLKMGASIAAGAAIAVATFIGFDDQMRVVQAVSGATAEEFAALTEEAKRLGATTSFSASQVAAGMAELGRAGFDPTQILGATESVLALSRATDTELPRATEIAGAALRGFGLEVDQMGRVADVLSATANGTAQGLEDLFEGLKPVAPLAAEAGESLEDTAAAVGILANNGIKGSLAGNALARAFKNLATSSKQADLRQLGVEATDSEGNIRPLIDIIADLDKATANFGEAERLAAFESLFGRGQAAALKLAEASRGAFGEVAAGIRNSQGAAAATAEAMDAGLGGSMRKLYSAVEGVAIALGEALAPTISKAADFVGMYAGKINEWIQNNDEMVVAIAAGVAAVTAISGALVVAGTVISSVGTVLGFMASAFSAISTVIGVLVPIATALLNPFVLIPAIVIGIVEAIAYFLGFGSPTLWLFEKLGNMAKWVGGLLWDVLGSTITWLTGKLQQFLGWIGKAIGGLIDFGDEAEMTAKKADKLSDATPDESTNKFQPPAPEQPTFSPPELPAIPAVGSPAELDLQDQAAQEAEAAAKRRAEENARQAEALQREAEALRDSVMTPTERLDEQLQKFDELAEKGLLDEETLRRLQEQAHEEAADALAGDLREATRAAEIDTAGAFNPAALAGLLRGSQSDDDRQVDAAETTAENTRLIARDINKMAASNKPLQTGS